MVVFILQKTAVSNVLETGASLLKPRLTKKIGQIYQAQDRLKIQSSEAKNHILSEVEGACLGRWQTPPDMHYSWLCTSLCAISFLAFYFAALTTYNEARRFKVLTTIKILEQVRIIGRHLTEIAFCSISQSWS